jgi:hypothetical protein
MTPADIRAAIQADPALRSLVPDTQAIADVLSDGRTRVVTRLGGVGVVMEALGPEMGAAILDGLDAMRATSSPIKWAWVLIERGELDFGSPTTRAMIGQLRDAGAIPEAAATALLSIAEESDPIQEMDVRRAVFADDGEILV